MDVDLTGHYVAGLHAIAAILLVSSIAPILIRPPRTAAPTRTLATSLIADWPTVVRDRRSHRRMTPGHQLLVESDPVGDALSTVDLRVGRLAFQAGEIDRPARPADMPIAAHARQSAK